MEEIIQKLYIEKVLTKEEWIYLIQNFTSDDEDHLYQLARKVQNKYYNNRVFARGLIEISNYCKNDCYYCGIRRGNKNIQRYRLTKEEILDCCENGYQLGFRTFVLQGGEDGYHTDLWVTNLVSAIHNKYKDCAITLSLGERSYESYQKFYEAGANRYLLRHETADERHYQSLHPKDLSGAERKKCLWTLKKIGFQTGTGFMVGVKGQTPESLANDMLFIKELTPHMVGIGPFVPHHDTPFGKEPKGSVRLTLFLIGLLRLMLPNVLLPATTALGTIDKEGREKGILAGANVVMPNLTPKTKRNKYELYDYKLCTDAESMEGLNALEKRMEKIGYTLSMERGDHPEHS